jgi:hypothetical protein
LWQLSYLGLGACDKDSVAGKDGAPLLLANAAIVFADLSLLAQLESFLEHKRGTLASRKLGHLRPLAATVG